MTVRLTFYGGAGEIGGNKFLVEDGDSRLFLDFGMSLHDRGRYFSEPFLSPRDQRGLIELGVMPSVDGLYKDDEGELPADAVVLSHAHIDHAACISLLNRKIPVYCGETTHLILQALSEIRPSSFENDLRGLDFRTFRTGEKIRVGGIELEPIHVDHSLPGAYGFIVRTSNGTIVYSGDFRAHGPMAKMTWEFVNKAAAEKPEMFLCEGTNLVRGDLQTEEHVLEKANHVVSKTKGLVLSSFSLADVDRLRTFHEAARKNNRSLAVSLKQAYLLNALAKDAHLQVPDALHDPNVVVYRKLKKNYFGWERSIIDKAQVKTSQDIRGMQDRVILVCSPYDMNEVLEIQPGPSGAFINSSSEPFTEEMEIDEERFVNWLDHFGLPRYQIHSSGHMMPTELRETVESVKPGTLVPIHTEQPELYALFVRDLAKVEQPRKNETITLGA